MATATPPSPTATELDLKTIAEHREVTLPEGIPEGFTWTPEEEKKLVRKIDLFLMPTIWLMYLLSYMDRTKFVIGRNTNWSEDH